MKRISDGLIHLLLVALLSCFIVACDEETFADVESAVSKTKDAALILEELLQRKAIIEDLEKETAFLKETAEILENDIERAEIKEKINEANTALETLTNNPNYDSLFNQVKELEETITKEAKELEERIHPQVEVETADRNITGKERITLHIKDDLGRTKEDIILNDDGVKLERIFYDFDENCTLENEKECSFKVSRVVFAEDGSSTDHVETFDKNMCMLSKTKYGKVKGKNDDNIPVVTDYFQCQNGKEVKIGFTEYNYDFSVSLSANEKLLNGSLSLIGVSHFSPELSVESETYYPITASKPTVIWDGIHKTKTNKGCAGIVEVVSHTFGDDLKYVISSFDEVCNVACQTVSEDKVAPFDINPQTCQAK